MTEARDAIVISDEILDAQHSGIPLLGLESSGITGGVYPHNLEIAEAVDQAARDDGVIPARVGVIHGQLRVGLSKADLEQLALAKNAPKISNRDLGISVAQKITGGTTVSASLHIAAQIGIAVFAVAGIGGVHRGAETSFDVSADLAQFTRSSIAVVCAGAKSLLDPGLTLEYLETAGVPVIGYRSDFFPGYYTQSTGFAVPHRVDELDDIVRAVHAHWDAAPSTAVLVTHPIAEKWSIDAIMLDGLVADALEAAAAAGESGARLTPFVLSALSKATAGRSTQVNDAVLLSTTKVGALLAKEEARQTAHRNRVGAAT